MQFVQELESERGDAKGEVLEEEELRDSVRIKIKNNMLHYS